jgi:hypothetical protein
MEGAGTVVARSFLPSTQNENRMYAWMVLGSCQLSAAPKPALLGLTLAGFNVSQ